MDKSFYIMLATLLFTNCAIRLTEDTKAKLVKELQEMVKTDQIAAAHWEPEWENYKDSVFNTHKIKIEKMFNK